MIMPKRNGIEKKREHNRAADDNEMPITARLNIFST